MTELILSDINLSDDVQIADKRIISFIEATPVPKDFPFMYMEDGYTKLCDFVRVPEGYQINFHCYYYEDFLKWWILTHYDMLMSLDARFLVMEFATGTIDGSFIADTTKPRYLSTCMNVDLNKQKVSDIIKIIKGLNNKCNTTMTLMIQCPAPIEDVYQFCQKVADEYKDSELSIDRICIGHSFTGICTMSKALYKMEKYFTGKTDCT